MARLEAPVMNTRRRAPAASASSTAYWMSGLSTTGSISLGLALVAGRKRVPRPATGNTALVITFMYPSWFKQLQQLCFIDCPDAEHQRFFIFAAGIVASNDKISLFRNAPAHFASH